MTPSFIRIAHRALEAADAALAVAISEKAGFLGYHAFESAGGAYCTSRGVRYHPISHPEKIRRFADSCRGERFGHAVAALRLETAALRNLLLYPQALPDGTVRRPETLMSVAQARRLIGRIRALVRQVEAVV